MAVCVPHLLYRCVHHRRQFNHFYALPSAHFRIIGIYTAGRALFRTAFLVPTMKKMWW